MPYSLTSASALGLDLARTPGGAGAAAQLVRGLGVDPGPAVPGTGPGPSDLAEARDRAVALLVADGPATVRLEDPRDPREPSNPSGPSDPAAARPGVTGALDALSTALRRLRSTAAGLALGTVHDLVDLASGLPVDATGRPGGAGVPGLHVRPAREAALGRAVADAVLAELVLARRDPAAPVLARALRAVLDASVLPEVGAPGDALPAGAVRDLVRAVAAAHAARLVRVGRTEPPTGLATGDAAGAWTTAMHDATWAVELTGRTRLAATAQLELVRALAVSGVDAHSAAAGTWNRCSGAVQALVVADLVGEETLCALHADLADDLA
ncbi:hypothetical protein [Aquipuribacter sp. SD81]|uniref:hypothetical protein n=1 Tax=Aquipuribacter sp. SD81 TaxID=3127703 RepID=UPI003019A376